MFALLPNLKALTPALYCVSISSTTSLTGLEKNLGCKIGSVQNVQKVLRSHPSETSISQIMLGYLGCCLTISAPAMESFLTLSVYDTLSNHSDIFSMYSSNSRSTGELSLANVPPLFEKAFPMAPTMMLYDFVQAANIL